ncbi:MAG: acyl carrier protein [Chloroflexota bacterium]
MTTITWTDFAEKIADYAGLEKEEVHQEMNIYADLGMDSLGLFSLGMYLIKTYGVEIPLAAVATIETVGDIFTLINAEIEKKP